MKPIRSEHQHDVIQDPWSNRQRAAQDQDTLHVLSPQGCLESHTVRRLVAADCGCLKPVGGFCGVCPDGTTSCVDCFGHCSLCHKPICTRHSIFPSEQNREAAKRICLTCHEAGRRTAIIQRVVRFVLAPFVVFRQAP